MTQAQHTQPTTRFLEGVNKILPEETSASKEEVSKGINLADLCWAAACFLDHKGAAYRPTVERQLGRISVCLFQGVPHSNAWVTTVVLKLFFTDIFFTDAKGIFQLSTPFTSAQNLLGRYIWENIWEKYIWLFASLLRRNGCWKVMQLFANFSLWKITKPEVGQSWHKFSFLLVFRRFPLFEKKTDLSHAGDGN